MTWLSIIPKLLDLFAKAAMYFGIKKIGRDQERLKANEEYIRRVNAGANPDIVPIDRDKSNRDNG